MEGGGGAWAELVVREEGCSVVLTWMGVASLVGTMLTVIKEGRVDLAHTSSFTYDYENIFSHENTQMRLYFEKLGISNNLT